LGCGWLIGNFAPEYIEQRVGPADQPLIHNAVLAATAIYILATAIPFVPGAEIGFGLIMVFGGRIAFLVYISMLIALTLAFVTGRHLPLSVAAKVFKRLGFSRANGFILKLSRLDKQQKLALLVENAPSRYIPFMLRHRYLLLMMILNLPGNSLVGGGGGIAFIAGLSGLFSYVGFLSAIAIAVAPIPVFFWLTS
jgi:hypothetical protein